jgi:hypothetical protein
MAGISGYVISSRSSDKKGDEGDLGEQVKEFRPDVIIDPYSGNDPRRVYEVEKTVSNNTIFKSLVSLLYFLSKNSNSVGTLVVPDNANKFAERCLGVMTEIIRNYDRGGPGAPFKIRIGIASFNEIVREAERLETWFQNGKRGAQPKCQFLPRV